VAEEGGARSHEQERDAPVTDTPSAVAAPVGPGSAPAAATLIAGGRAALPHRLAHSPAAVIALQRAAGNRAVAAAIQRQPPTAPPPPTPVEVQLNRDFQQQMSQQPPDYDGAAVTLNRFPSSADIDALVGSLSHPDRVGLFVGALRTLLLTPPPHRVTDSIHRIDGVASRDGRIAYVREAVGRSEWRQVALALNGFSDPDIDWMAESVLPAASLPQIRSAAQTHMPGWSDRVVRGLNRIIVAGEMGRMADPAAPTRAVWGPSGNNPARTNFSAWAMAASETPFTVSPTTKINCWEMVLYSAYKSGSLSWSAIHAIYSYAGPNPWYVELANRLARSTRTWDRVTKRPVPRRGDIVMFDGASHVALATGVTDAAGTHIYSFWPPPDITFLAGGTPDRVKDTTIELLVPVCDAINASATPPEPPCVVTFGPPGAW
jgi:hypothetical protein